MNKIDTISKQRSKSSTRVKLFSFLLPFCLCILTFLTGCVRYDVGIDFQEEHRGKIVQTIHLGEQLTNFSQIETQQWLTSLENRVKKIHGKIKKVSDQELVVSIPFGNGQELVSKFNKFFNSTASLDGKSQQRDAIDVLKIKSNLSLQQSNLLLVQRNKLSLKIDLSELGVTSNQGNILVSPGSLVDLQFSLHNPWGGRTIIDDDNAITAVSNQDNQIVWQLKSGQVNYLETVFWLPSYLGIGTVIILLLVLGGFYLKYKRLPGSHGYSKL